MMWTMLCSIICSALWQFRRPFCQLIKIISKHVNNLLVHVSFLMNSNQYIFSPPLCITIETRNVWSQNCHIWTLSLLYVEQWNALTNHLREMTTLNQLNSRILLLYMLFIHVPHTHVTAWCTWIILVLIYGVCSTLYGLMVVVYCIHYYFLNFICLSVCCLLNVNFTF